MAIALSSQAVKQLPLKAVIGQNYSAILTRRIIDDQIVMIKALQEDVKTLAAMIEAQHP